MGWDVGNYTPGMSGTPFDFDLLRLGFERLRMGEDNGNAPDVPTSWSCKYQCGASGTEINAEQAETAKDLHESYCDRNPNWK